MDINTITNVIAIILAVGNFICLYRISRKKAYNEEKGKNLATKEDIAGITKEIESIKEYYNKSLENYKIELQKEFETSKYIINLCNLIDKSLITLIANALNSYHSQGIGPEYDDREFISSAYEISDFLHTYQSRYEGNKILDELKDISSEIKTLSEKEDNPFISHDGIMIYLAKLNSAVSLFLPKF